MNKRHLLLSLALILGASSLFAQAPYKHDPTKTEELRTRDGLPNFFKKLKAGEKVNVGFIGGSITNGGLWRPKLIDWLKTEYSTADITQVNAAMGGTGPDFGACRIGNHLLVHNPDIVFIEYRVNNGGAFQGRALEGLIPQIWRKNPNAEICIVYTISKGMIADIKAGNQTSAGKFMEPVANHYGITSIDYGVEVVKQLNAGSLIFQAKKAPEGKVLFSKDGTHPIEAGHDIYRDVLVRSLKAIADHGASGPNVIPEPSRKKTFANASLVPVSTATFSKGWEQVDLGDEVHINDDLTDKNGGAKTTFDAAMKTAAVGESFTLKWDGFFLGFTAVLQGKGEVILEITTDGGKPRILDLASRSGKVQSKYIFTKEIQSGTHTSTVKVIKLAPGKSCQLGQFLVVAE